MNCNAGDPAAPAQPFGAYDAQSVIAGGCAAWDGSGAAVPSETATAGSSTTSTDFAGTWTGQLTYNGAPYEKVRVVLTGSNQDLSGKVVLADECSLYRITEAQVSGITLTATGQSTAPQTCANLDLTFEATSADTLRFKLPMLSEPSMVSEADLARQ